MQLRSAHRRRLGPEAALVAAVGIFIAATAVACGGHQARRPAANGLRRDGPGPLAPPLPVDPTQTTVVPGTTGGPWRSFTPGPLATRNEVVAVWTGKEMLVAGGVLVQTEQPVNDGAAYDPATDRWRPIAARPVPGRVLAGVWTGKDMIVWGSAGFVLTGPLSDGMAYDAATDAWRPIAANPFPFPAEPPIVAWTGSRVLLWPGREASTPARPGALYDPVGNRWSAMPPVTLPGIVAMVGGVWTGKVFAVLASGTPPNGGPVQPQLLLFDPAAGTWKAAAPGGNLAGGDQQVAWSGAEVFVFDSGGGHAYAPALGTWRAAAGPALTIGPGVFRSATLTGNRLVARVADPAVVVDAYDRAADRWLPSGPPPGLPSSVDGAFVSTGSSVITWGIPQNSSELQLGTPNAAWIWSPP